MARFEFRGIEEYINKLDTFRLVTKDSIIARTTYAGAAVVANAVRKSIEALPVGSGKSEDGGLIDTVTAAQNPEWQRKKGHPIHSRRVAHPKHQGRKYQYSPPSHPFFQKRRF